MFTVKRLQSMLSTVGRERARTDPGSHELARIPAVSPDHQPPAVQGGPLSFYPIRRLRRSVGWAIASVVIALLAVPVGIWIHYQSAYAMSRNAMVRGHLTEIGSRLAGVVTTIEVDAGDRVTAGQVLVRLEDRHFQAEAQRAHAELAGLERELDVERSAILYEERRLQNQLEEASANLTAVEAQLAAAESQADDARGFYRARSPLLKKGAIASEEIRDARAKSRTADAHANAAQAEYAAARSAEQRARLDVDGLAIRKQRIGVLEAGILRAQARLAAAQADLEATSIRAPADGAVVLRILEPGGSVDIGQPIMSLRLGEDLWIEAWLDEDDIADVKIGSIAKVTLQSFPDQEFSGVVKTLGLTTDFEMPPSEVPQPRFMRMRGAPVVGVGIRLEDPPPDLLPGLSAVVGIRRSTP